MVALGLQRSDGALSGPTAMSHGGGPAAAPSQGKNRVMMWGCWDYSNPRTPRISEASPGNSPDDFRVMATPTPLQFGGQPFDFGAPVRQTVAGDGYMLILLENGEVYANGVSSCGCLGLGSRKEDSVVPQPTRVRFAEVGDDGGRNRDDGAVGEDRLESPVRIVEIAKGWQHVLALDTEGRVWSWGLNSKGQLGLCAPSESGEDVFAEPSCVVTLAGNYKVRQVAAVRDASFAVTEEGEVWCWGCGSGGMSFDGAPMLGLGENAAGTFEGAGGPDKHGLLMTGRDSRESRSSEIVPFPFKSPNLNSVGAGGEPLYVSKLQICGDLVLAHTSTDAGVLRNSSSRLSGGGVGAASLDGSVDRLRSGPGGTSSSVTGPGPDSPVSGFASASPSNPQIDAQRRDLQQALDRMRRALDSCRAWRHELEMKVVGWQDEVAASCGVEDKAEPTDAELSGS
eukprot:gene107-169_t